MTASGIYPEWQPRPHRLLLCDPSGTLRWVRVNAAIGPFDARSQAAYQWPESDVVEITDTPEPEARLYAVEHRNEAHDTCSGCGCWWDLDDTWEPNVQQEWCSQTCRCHTVQFIEEWIREQNGEKVVAFIEPEDGAA